MPDLGYHYPETEINHDLDTAPVIDYSARVGKALAE